MPGPWIRTAAVRTEGRRQSDVYLKFEHRVGKGIRTNSTYRLGCLDGWYFQPSKIKNTSDEPERVLSPSDLCLLHTLPRIWITKSYRPSQCWLVSLFLSYGFQVNCPKQRNRTCTLDFLLLLGNPEKIIYKSYPIRSTKCKCRVGKFFSIYWLKIFSFYWLKMDTVWPDLDWLVFAPPVECTGFC